MLAYTEEKSIQRFHVYRRNAEDKNNVPFYLSREDSHFCKW